MSDNMPVGHVDDRQSPGEGDSYQEIVRILIGSVLEGGQAAAKWLRQPVDQSPNRSQTTETSGENDRLLLATVGMAFQSAHLLGRGLRTALRASVKIGDAIVSPALKAAEYTPLRNLNSRLDDLASKGEMEVDKWVKIGQAEEGPSRQAAKDSFDRVVQSVIDAVAANPAIQDLIRAQLDLLVDELPETPQVDSLVRAVAGNYINYLGEHPEQVQMLIRNQGNVYIAYLNENPEPVQTLIQGQSTGLISDIADEVRERTVTVDTILETLVRTVFRRAPRSTLPGPPPLVRARAVNPRMEGDFPRLESDFDSAPESD